MYTLGTVGEYDVIAEDPYGWTWAESQPGLRLVGSLDAAIVGAWDFVPTVVISLWGHEPRIRQMWATDDPDELDPIDVLLGESTFPDSGGGISERVIGRVDGSGEFGQQLVIWRRSSASDRVVQVVGTAMVSQSDVVGQRVWDLVRSIKIRGQEES